MSCDHHIKFVPPISLSMLLCGLKKQIAGKHSSTVYWLVNSPSSLSSWGKKKETNHLAVYAIRLCHFGS